MELCLSSRTSQRLVVSFGKLTHEGSAQIGFVAAGGRAKDRLSLLTEKARRSRCYGRLRGFVELQFEQNFRDID